MKKEEIIVNCIDDIQAGRQSLKDCITRHPELAGELREYYRLIKGISSKSVSPSAEFKLRAWNRLIEAMDATEAKRAQAKPLWQSLLVNKFGYSVAVAVALAAGTGVTAFAAQSSLPQDTLYPVKTALENVQMALTLNPESKALLHLQLAERRVQEVAAEVVSGQSASPSALNSAVDQIDDAVRAADNMPGPRAGGILAQVSQATSEAQASLQQISKTAPQSAQPALQQAIRATRRGSMIASVASRNPAVLNAGASVRDSNLDSSYFEIEGNLADVQGGNWTIGSIILQNVNAPAAALHVGSDVKLNGIVRNNKIYIGKMDWQDKSLSGTKINGVFSGTSTDGTTWRVGGISVTGVPGETAPSVNDKVEISETPNSTNYTVVNHASDTGNANQNGNTGNSDNTKGAGDNNGNGNIPGNDNRDNGNSNGSGISTASQSDLNAAGGSGYTSSSNSSDDGSHGSNSTALVIAGTGQADSSASGGNSDKGQTSGSGNSDKGITGSSDNNSSGQGQTSNYNSRGGSKSQSNGDKGMSNSPGGSRNGQNWPTIQNEHNLLQQVFSSLSRMTADIFK